MKQDEEQRPARATDPGAWARAVMEALPDPVLLIDPTLVVTAANRPALELLGRERAQVVARTLADLLVPEDAQAVRDAGGALLGASPTRSSSAVVLPDGSRVPVSLEVRPLHVESLVQGALLLLRSPAGREASSNRRDPGAGADLTAELAEALRGDQIILHYQPIVRLSDQRPTAAEALVRWEHPRRGLLSPGEFLSTADTPALAGALGTRVLRQASHAAAIWNRTLGSETDLQVSVNLSERQLLQPGTVALVRHALNVAECPADRLLLEVAEGSLLSDPEAALQSLRGLKELGCDIAVDDLGTAVSSLSYLARFPVDVVKIDRSLVSDLGTDNDQTAVAASLVSLAQAMGVRCVAEGVETTDQLGILNQLGCDFAQGYLFARAMNVQTATDWLSRALTNRTGRAAAGRGAPPAPHTVQRVLELQGEGASLHTIAARLNAEGHRNAGDRRWHHKSVAQAIAAHRFPDLQR